VKYSKTRFATSFVIWYPRGLIGIQTSLRIVLGRHARTAMSFGGIIRRVSGGLFSKFGPLFLGLMNLRSCYLGSLVREFLVTSFLIERDCFGTRNRLDHLLLGLSFGISCLLEGLGEVIRGGCRKISLVGLCLLLFFHLGDFMM